MIRLLMLIATALIAASAVVTTSFAQNTRETVTPPADLHPPVTLDADTLRARLTPGNLGLKPQSYSGAGIGGLPYGLNYNRDTKGLVMPLDEKNEWGVGVGLNLNSSQTVELSPNGLQGIQPKRAPGLLLNRKF